MMNDKSLELYANFMRLTTQREEAGIEGLMCKTTQCVAGLRPWDGTARY